MRLPSSKLSKSENSGELWSDHEDLRTYWSEDQYRVQRCLDLVDNQPWTEEDLEAFRLKRIKPVKLHVLKATERAIIGYFSKSKFSVKFSQVGPEANLQANAYQAVYDRDFRANGGHLGDAALIRSAWATGAAYQELWVENVKDTGDWQVRWRNLERSQVLWDPESKALGSREDARFVDVETLMDMDELIAAFPARKSHVEAGFKSPSGFDPVNRVNDDLESEGHYRNGKAVVIERFYKLAVPKYTIHDEKGLVFSETEDHEEAMKAEAEGMQYSCSVAYELWYAAAAPGVTDEYLYNGKYPLQARDPMTGSLIYPIVECIAESLNAKPVGFVEHQYDAVRGINSMVNALLHSAKHSASQSKIADPTAFENDAEAQRFAREHTDADAVFFSKPNRLGSTHEVVQKSQVSNDVYQSLNILREMVMEVSSTPPAFMGTDPRTNISGNLNGQRIDQGAMGLSHFKDNYVDFQRRRAVLAANLWAGYYDQEEVLEILDDTQPGLKQYVAVNGTNPIKMADVLRYDVFVEESPFSETQRQRLQGEIVEMLQSPAIQHDPVLASFLYVQWLRLSDVPEELKASITEHSSTLMAYAQQKAQAEAMQMQAQTQGQVIQNVGAQLQNEATGMQNGTPPQPQA